MKLYIYGYLHRIRASRRLEAEACHNVQVMWLLNRLRPAFKTIADFRKDHPKAIVGVCRAFIRFCREQSLFGAELLAIDGTKIAAVASRKRVMTPKKIEQMNAAIDRRIAQYLASMDEADREVGEQRPRASTWPRRSQRSRRKSWSCSAGPRNWPGGNSRSWS